MKFKKTLFLFILLAVLVAVAYLLERPKKTALSVELFPEFTLEAATKIDILNKGEDVILVKTDTGWKLEDATGFPIDPDMVKKTLESITEIKKENNVASNNPENQNLFEVDPNTGIEVKISDTNSKILANFFVGKTGPDFMSTYLRKVNSDEVLLCPGYHLRSSFTRTSKNWYDLKVNSFSKEEIEKIKIVEGDKILSLKKDQDIWYLTDPNEALAKKNLADDIANTLARLRGSDLLKADNLEEYELSPPKKQILISLSDGSEKIITIGKKNDKNQYHLKAEKNVVYLVPQYNINKFNKTFEELKEVPPEKEPKEPEGPETNSQKIDMPPSTPPKVDSKIHQESKQKK